MFLSTQPISSCNSKFRQVFAEKSSEKKRQNVFLYYHLFYIPGGLDTQNFKMALNLDEELYDVNARLREIEEMCSDSDDDEADNEPR